MARRDPGPAVTPVATFRIALRAACARETPANAIASAALPSRLDELRMLGVKAADLVEHAGIMLLGLGRDFLNLRRASAPEACCGVICGNIAGSGCRYPAEQSASQGGQAYACAKGAHQPVQNARLAAAGRICRTCGPPFPERRRAIRLKCVGDCLGPARRREPSVRPPSKCAGADSAPRQVDCQRIGSKCRSVPLSWPSLVRARSLSRSLRDASCWGLAPDQVMQSRAG